MTKSQNKYSFFAILKDKDKEVYLMKNIGKVDKIIRIVIGIVLLSLLFILQGNVKYIGLIGVIPLVTAFIGFCPLYKVLGITTNKDS